MNENRNQICGKQSKEKEKVHKEFYTSSPQPLTMFCPHPSRWDYTNTTRPTTTGFQQPTTPTRLQP